MVIAIGRTPYILACMKKLVSYFYFLVCGRSDSEFVSAAEVAVCIALQPERENLDSIGEGCNNTALSENQMNVNYFTSLTKF